MSLLGYATVLHHVATYVSDNNFYNDNHTINIVTRTSEASKSKVEMEDKGVQTECKEIVPVPQEGAIIADLRAVIADLRTKYVI